MPIDLNADIAEGCPHDAELMQYVQSVNIACATHAGSPAIMVHALREAKAKGLRIGAHPGYFDRENFGRKEMPVTPEELYHILVYQLGAMRSLAEQVGIPISYVKPHGAIYHQVASDQQLAKALVDAARQFNLAIIGQPGTVIANECQKSGITYLKEGFADRRYQPDGTLVPRTQPDAMLHDPLEAAKQVRWLIDTLHVDTICVHGDEPEAVAFVKEVRKLLG
jgi:5-oxoprolinase (ATP-hydrolysing) subunit A